ncbi:MAG: dihydrofolate reductase, partial [Geodermatophilaceae bacterium]|nr:dihydrofolate reductase [Geodermatophilaceae bacterium]
MRKIVNSTYTTLDGDITNMQRWRFDFFTESDESGAAAHDLMFGSDALIMGRQTYEGFAPAWSERA